MSRRKHISESTAETPAAATAAATGATSTTAADVRRAAWPVRAADAGRNLAISFARALDDNKCEDVIILDVRGVSQICDFFVVATGTSDRQMRAAADHVEDVARTVGDKPYGRSGYDEGSWIVVDYVDVVVHVFSGELRAYYDLEGLWGDGQRLDWTAGS